MPDVMTNKPPKGGKTPTHKPRKMSEIKNEEVAKTDLPEYIKSEELQAHFPFTIFGAAPDKGRFGDRVRFDVAFKIEGVVNKRVWTPSVTKDRTALMLEVRQGGAITGCRLVELDLSGGYTYWKVIGADEPLPENVIIGDARSVRDEEIPFD